MNKKIGDMNESELKDFIIELQEENSRYERRIEKLEDSWKQLKEYVENNNYYFTKTDLQMASNKLNAFDILNKMKGLERGVSDVED